MKPILLFTLAAAATVLPSAHAAGTSSATPTITRLTAPIGPTTGEPSIPAFGSAMAATDKAEASRKSSERALDHFGKLVPELVGGCTPRTIREKLGLADSSLTVVGPDGKPTPLKLSRDQAKAQSPRLAVDTPALSGSIALRGARIDDLWLKRYGQTTAKNAPPVELLRPEGATHAWFADMGWTGANVPGLPNAQTLWTLAQGSVLAPGKPVTLTYANGQGLTFTRVISVDDKFMFTVKDTVANTGARAGHRAAADGPGVREHGDVHG